MTLSGEWSSPLRSLRYLDEFLNSTVIGFAYFEDGVVRDCNEAIARLLHTTPDRLIGLDVFSETLRQANDETPFFIENPEVVAALNAATAYSDVVVGVNFADAPRRWFSVDTFPVPELAEQSGVIASFYDVTRDLRRERMLRLFHEVSGAIAVAEGVDEALGRLVESLCDVGGYRVAWISFETEDSGGRLEIANRAGAVGYLDGLELSANPVSGRGPTGRSLRSQSVQVVHHVARDGALSPWHERAKAFGIDSIVALPLTIGDRRAVVSVADHDIFVFDDETILELRGLLAEVELLVARVQAVTELRSSLEGTVAAMTRITEIRDPYTAGHQTRVSALSRAIATWLGLDDEQVEAIAKSAALHDLGKIVVPAEILGRPGKLNPLEMEAVQRHCIVGAEVLEQSSLSGVFVDVARHHHERLDGSGYPDGLAGDEISLAARIVAVADVFEAMTHHRPHRPGYSVDEALLELVTGAGVRYDAGVVEACGAVLAAGYEIDG
ncbi:MAG: HD domain-containing phosphohydrolase [Acidimicrobiales bacterium]